MANNITLTNTTANISGNIQNLIANVVNQAVVRSTGGTPTTGINGFVFDIVAEEEIIQESEITSHYVEDNYAIQDHIAQKPIRVTVRGYIGEITDLFPNTLLSVLTAVQSLDSIGLFLPAFSAQATQVYAKAAGFASQVGNYINQAKNIYSLLNNADTSSSKQQQAYKTLTNFRLNNQLCTVETPWGIFYQMAIERISPVQKEDTRFISEFTVSFVQIRTVQAQIILPTLNNPAGTGTTLPALSGLPSTPYSAVPLLTASQRNLASNTVGRVAQMTDPTNILGQTPGQNSTVSAVLNSFPQLTTVQ